MSHRAEAYHPSEAELGALKVGKLTPPKSVEVERHLAECETCCEVLKTLPDDSLVQLLQGDRPESYLATTLAIPGDAGTEPQLPPGLASLPRYEILGLLGRGGMGAVYKAEHRLMERPVALKVINPALVSRPAMVERFRREVKAAARLSHPNIVTAFDADQAGDAHFLVMEFVEGVSLAQYVEEHGRLPIAEACDYVRQAALGLQFAAEHGMVHRDIKPHNLMRTPDGQVKILDFGLARLLREEAADGGGVAPAEVEPLGPGTPPQASLTEAGTLMGTADFIAPEQADDPRRADIRADLYSLGCTLYYLLTGTVPFPGGTVLDKVTAHRERGPAPLTKLRPDVPTALAGVIDRLMAKDPARRYQTPAEAAEALAPFTTAAVVRRQRVRRLAWAGTALAAAMLAAAVIYVQTDHGELVIEAEGDRVAVLVQDGGVKVRDETTKREYQIGIGRHRFRPGEYLLNVQELPAGVEVSTREPFLLKRGATAVVKVTFNPRKAPGYLKEDALRWFPADATFFFAMNMEVVPDIARIPLLLSREAGGEQSRRLLDLIGRIDRMSYAYVGNRKHPELAREFLRFTGKIARERVIDHFRRQWVGTLQETRRNGEDVVILHDTKQGGGAVALIGTTDLLMAGYHGPVPSDLPVVQECLDLRAGRGANLPAAQAALLGEFPDDAWEIVAGEVPEFFRKTYVFAFMRPIQSGVFWVRGTDDLEIGARATFATAADAKRFAMTTDLMKLVFMSAPMVLKDAELSAAVAKAFASLRTEIKGEQLTGHVRIPHRAWTALVEKMADTPLQELVETPALNPAKRPAAAPAGTIFRGHLDKVTGVAFSPDGRQALSSSDDKTVRLWDVATGRQLRAYPGHGTMVLSVAFAADGRRFLSSAAWTSEANVDPSIRLWDVETGQVVSRLLGHTGGVWQVVCSADGKLALSGSQDTTLRLWDLTGELAVRKFAGHTEPVRSVALSPDGRLALSGSWDRTVRLWDVATGREVRRLEGLADRVNTVALSPDGRLALAGGGDVENPVDTKLHLWDVSTGAKLRRFEGHTKRVWCVAFSPDGRRILSGSADGTLRLWDVATGQALASFDGHTADVRCVAFAPDGRSALSGSHDETLQLWKLP